MGKLKRTGIVNTYGKKKKTNTVVNNVKIVNVTNHFVVNNYFNIIKSPSREEKVKNCSKETSHDLTKYHSSSNSVSGDEFDKVLKGPIYNAPGRPITSSSGDEFDLLLKGPTYNAVCSSNSKSPSNGWKYFRKRQDTFNSYCSDASPVKSDVSSVHLFKDCSSSMACIYSPLHTLHLAGQNKKNKWIVSSSTKLKKTDHVYKKKVKRNVKTNSSASRKVRSDYTISSTPTHPDSKNWEVPHVSPILPPTAPNSDHNQSIVDMFESANSDDEAKQPQPTLGISALARQFDDLWRAPNNDKNIGDCSSQIITTSKETTHSRKTHADVFSENNHNEELDSSKNFIGEVTSPVLKKNIEELSINGSNLDHEKSQQTSAQRDVALNIINSVYPSGLEPNSSQNDANNALKLNVQEQSLKSDYKNNLLLSGLSRSFHGFDLSDTEHLHKSMRDNIVISHSYLDNKENRKSETNFNVVHNSESLLSLTPGKQWRRSFLKRKQSVLKRSTIGPSLIAKLIKDEACSYLESSSRHSYTASRCIYKQNDGTLNNVTENSRILSSAMSNSYLIPSSPEMKNKISFRYKGKHKKNLFWDKSMEQIIEESLVLEDQSFNDSINNSTELKFVEESPYKVSNFSSSNLRTPIENVTNDSPVTKDFNPVSHHTSLDMTYTIYSNNCDQNNTKYDASPTKNISTMSPTLNETCPLEKMPELLNTITKRKKPDLQRSLTEEEYALLREYEYSFNEDKSQLIQETPINCVLLICRQEWPVSFTEVFSELTLSKSKKIGEGVYGEVFMISNSENNRSVLKIIPVEGSRLVNNERQKKFEEVLSELIITQQLSLLRENEEFCTSGFCLLKNLYCLKGEYPPILIKHWEQFNREKKSYNDCPDIFDEQQLYIALELDHAGEPIESFVFASAKQAYSVLLQISFSLAIAEMVLEFEHRDLHIGNVLLSKTTDEYADFIYDRERIKLHTYKLKATIIDFTLSRVSYKDDVLYFDLASDPELFNAQGDYQFEVYRLMRNDVSNQWRTHAPVTNTRWLYYLADKLSHAKYSCKKTSKIHSGYLKKIEDIKDIIEDFSSSSEFVNGLMKTELHGESIIHEQL